jgi:nucleotide-binding universal stress UspA family protein
MADSFAKSTCNIAGSVAATKLGQARLDLITLRVRRLGAIDLCSIASKQMTERTTRNEKESMMTSTPFKRILVGANGTKGSERALEVAISLAASIHAQIILLGVIAPLSAETQAEGFGLEEASKARADLEEQLRSAERVAHEQGVDVATEIIEGDPDKVIEPKSEEASADLIVVGHRDVGRVRRWLEGSTSETLVRKSQVSILVVHDHHSL